MDKELKEFITLTKNELILEINKIRKELQGLVEIQQKLIHVNLNAPLPPLPKEYSSEKPVETGNFEINIAPFGDRIKVTGKGTFKYKDLIKEIGQVKWEQDLKFWSLPLNLLAPLLKKFSDKGLIVGKDIGMTVPSTLKVEEDDDEYGDCLGEEPAESYGFKD